MVTKERVAQGVAVLALGWASLVLMSTAGAAVFVVDASQDEVDANPGDGVCLSGNGFCTLRAAVMEANALAGADTIELGSDNYVLALTGGNENNSASGDLDVRTEITINGVAADETSIDGYASDRVLDVREPGKLTINKVRLRNGKGGTTDGGGAGINIDSRSFGGATVIVNDSVIDGHQGMAFGGGINNFFGNLDINRTRIANNTVVGVGGGIHNMNGYVTITDSTIENNRNSGFNQPFGGGIYNSAFPGSMVIRNSTIKDNTAFLDGGGIYHIIGDLRIYNTTISGNKAERWGGGMYHKSSAHRTQMVHVTITENSSIGVHNQDPLDPKGGGIYNAGQIGNPSKIDLYNSVISANGNGHNCYNVTAGAVITKVGSVISDDTCLNEGEAAPDPIPTASDIKLGALADNNGPTWTHALLAGSVAIAAGSDAHCTDTDQRGYSRPASACDAGAFETDAEPPVTPEPPPPPVPVDPPPAGDNVAPVAFDMPVAVIAGGIVTSVASAADADGDFLTYQIATPATKGTAGFTGSLMVPGEFTYRANAGASGMDQFTFVACDNITCSNVGTITVLIVAGQVAQSVGVELETGGTISDFTVASQSEITALVADVNYAAPFGAFFFDVTDVSTDPNSNEVVVVIQLPRDAVIASDAVVRKLDVTNVWRTLDAGPHPTLSTGTIDPVTRTIRLVLRDNDIFDQNPALGVIRDPVALGVPVEKAAVVDAPSAASTTTTTTTGGSSSSKVTTSGGGGGAISPLWLLVLLVPMALRRRGWLQ